jgi:hypothetical protein
MKGTPIELEWWYEFPAKKAGIQKNIITVL